MKAFLTAVAVAAALAITPAQADDSRGAGWNGLYLSAALGAGAVVHKVNVNPILTFDGIGGEGIFGSFGVGYDRALGGNWVGGVFADYDISGISTELTIAGTSISLDQKYSWSVGGRLGYLVSPSTLWYGMIGYTQSKFDLSLPTGFGSLDVGTFNGYFVGAGVESQLGRGWSLKAEYRFSDYSNKDILTFGPIAIGLEPSTHTARIGMSYKFNRDEAPAHQPMK